MKYIHPRILKWLKRVGKYLINICPTMQYAFSSNLVAEHRHFLFYLITITLLLLAVNSIWFNRSIFAAILLISNAVFILPSDMDYIKFTCVCGILIFLCLTYITYLFYLEEHKRLSSSLVGKLVYMLLSCIVIVGMIWGLFIYYSYVCIIQVNITQNLEYLTNTELILNVFMALLGLFGMRNVANVYGSKYPILTVFCIIFTLVFFNIAIAHIFGTFLYFDNNFFQDVSISSEVYIFLLFTICYLGYFFICDKGIAYFALPEWYLLAILSGFALGLRLCFYTTDLATCMACHALDIFISDFFYNMWFVSLGYYGVFALLDVLVVDKAGLFRFYVGIWLFTIFIYLGLFCSIVFTYATLGLPIPPVTSDLLLLLPF